MRLSRGPSYLIAAALLAGACGTTPADGPLGLPTAATRTTAPGGPSTAPAPGGTARSSPTASPSGSGSPSPSTSASPSASATSTPGTTVMPPRLAQVQATQTTMTIRFDRPMRTGLTCGTGGSLSGPFDALDSSDVASHYQSTDGVLDEAIRSVTRATILSDCTGIRLELALPAAPGTYTVTVTNVADVLGNGVDPAHAAAQTTIVDAGPPAVVAVDAAADAVVVSYSEPMLEIGEGSGVIMVGNYRIDGGPVVAKTIACVDRGCRAVRITLATALGAGSRHTVRVANVVDRAGRAIAPDPTTIAFDVR